MRRSTTILILSSAAFAVAGAVCRLRFPWVHSRYQIAAFCIAAVLVQLGAAAWFGRPGTKAARLAFVWNAAAASLGIILIRLALEGVPYKVLSVLGAIRA